MRNLSLRSLPWLLAGLLLAIPARPSAAVAGDHWPQWRGPAGDGVSRERELPFHWSESQGIRWKCPLPPSGASTPAVWGEAVFVTAHTAEDELLLLRIDASRGTEVWRRVVGRGTAVREAPKRLQQKFHRLHNLASPSPVTDGDTVVVHFGNGDLAAYDFEGKQRWKRNLQDDYGEYSIWWGHANSPVLFNDTVISVCMQDSLAGIADRRPESYLVAHNLSDGRVRWKTPRVTKADAEECDSYTTPFLLETEQGKQLVVMGGNQLDAYNPADGSQLWFLPGLIGGRTVTGPTAAGGLVYATIGMRGATLAVRPGSGELTRRAILWKNDQGTPDSCSPVVWDRWLYTISDDGIARCFDAETGALQWKERLKGGYKASPLAADGRIYFLNTEGLCTVVSAAPRFDKLTENQVDDETLASPAVAGGRIYLRGHHALYCIGP